MKIVLNSCYGGFELSYKAVMRYAELKGFKLYAFIDDRNNNVDLDYKHFAPYNGKDKVFMVHYSKKPLNSDGTYEEKSYFSERDIQRNDETLVQVVMELGNQANGTCSDLRIVEIPDNIGWEIEDYDGKEWVSEKHRTWV
jgi:hypothetical protein